MTYDFKNYYQRHLKFNNLLQYEIPKESFAPPDGWSFDGDWVVSVDRAIEFDNEQGLTGEFNGNSQGQLFQVKNQVYHLTDWLHANC